MATVTGQHNCAEQHKFSHNLLADITVTTMFEQISEVSEAVLFWVPVTFQRRLKVLHCIIDFHEDTSIWHEFKEHIFDLERIMDRMTMFLTSAVMSSSSTVKKGTRMSAQSLHMLQDDVLGLIINFCQHLTSQLSSALMERLERHCRYLIEMFNLPRDVHPKQYWGPAKLRILIEETFNMLASPKSEMMMDQILQNNFLWTLMLMTGCCPGLFLRNSHYKDEWLKFSDIALQRTPQQGVFDLLVTIRHWKGGHTNRPYVATFTVCAITHENMWMMDAGMQLIAIDLHCRGFLLYRTLDELLDGNDLILQWTPEFCEESVFCGGVPGGHGLAFDKVLHYDRACHFLKMVAASCGLGGVLEGVVLYCFQRGLAALLYIIFGSETAKGVLHHQVNSDTLSERYSNATLTVNLVGAVTEGVGEQLRETTNTNAPALHRSENTKCVGHLSMEDAVKSHPRLQSLFMARKFLAEHIKAALTDWTLILLTLVDIWNKDGEAHFIDDLGL